MISGMNHAVLYVRDARRHQKFYADVLGFNTVIDGAGAYVFMRAPESANHHDIVFFSIGEDAGPPRPAAARSACTTSRGRSAPSMSWPTCASG